MAYLIYIKIIKVSIVPVYSAEKWVCRLILLLVLAVVTVLASQFMAKVTANSNAERNNWVTIKLLLLLKTVVKAGVRNENSADRTGLYSKTGG